jgi:hypothetical protein
MKRRRAGISIWLGSAAIACLAIASGSAMAQSHGERPEGVATKGEFEGITPETVRMLYKMYAPPASLDEVTRGRVSPDAVPDVFGHGSVLTVGKIVEKVTNFGFNANPFQNVSSDPGGQWPGQSGVEFLFAQTIAVGGVNPGISPGDPVSRRRVSSGTEWRPASLQPEDRIYPSYDGAVNGVRFSNDDGDTYIDQDGSRKPFIDEDFLDGRDNDGDGKVDEDYGAVGQQMFSLVMRDDTIEAIQFSQAEPHVPLGLECQEKAWAYSISSLENFNVFEYTIINRSGHEIDSVVVGFPIDMDCGPVEKSNYFTDDLDNPQFPSGSFTYVLPDDDARRQKKHDPVLYTQFPAGTSLCDHLNLRVNGFGIADDDGDEGKTTGVPSLLLINHTLDLSDHHNGPWRVGWRAFRSYTGGTPYTQGGPPRIDQQRFEFMTGNDNIDNDDQSKGPRWGFINSEPGDQKGDYAAWCAVGPWLHVLPNASVQVTIAFAVARGNYADNAQYPVRYAAFKRDSAANPQRDLANQAALFAQYPALKNAFDAQVAYEGIWEHRAGFPVTSWHGRETSERLPRGSLPQSNDQDCRDSEIGNFRPVTADAYTWFDFDCDYCTGIWDAELGVGAADPTIGGMFHKVWNSSAPPPNPTSNASVIYNYTDNPDRLIAPGRDNKITLAWNNLSETTPDPSDKKEFDFRGYKIWKVSNWTRPVGSPGPAEDDWALIADFRMFDYRNTNNVQIANNAIGKKLPPVGGDPADTLIYPRVWIPQLRDSLEIRLNSGDLWDRQSGRIMRPDTSLQCVKDALGRCVQDSGCVLDISPCRKVGRAHYPIGRYRYEDPEVKNGFLYFYSVTAYDSTRDGMTEGRRTAVEAEGVVPQTIARATRSVWVVPNPYKGFKNLSERPSSWDLTPNSTDPTGTHVDFYGLPFGAWTIRIYTVSGDLVQEIRSTDAVNQSVRSPVTSSTGTSLPGYNRQQDNPNDGQARWNLISRNGQDVVSGIYLFTVESNLGTQRGRFVIIR